MTHLFQVGDFTLRSGAKSRYKIECDGLTAADWEGLAEMAAPLLPPFAEVVGVERGGVPFAQALSPHRTTDGSTSTILIAEDVFTTGGSMQRERAKVTDRRFSESGGKKRFTQFAGVVAFARGPIPPAFAWVTPVWSLTQPPPASDEELLAAAGWALECKSPFEIHHTDGSRATGQAAEYVLAALKAGDE